MTHTISYYEREYEEEQERQEERVVAETPGEVQERLRKQQQQQEEAQERLRVKLQMEAERERKRIEEIMKLELDILKNPDHCRINKLKIITLDASSSKYEVTMAKNMLDIHDNLSKKEPDLEQNKRDHKTMQANMALPFWTHVSKFIKDTAEFFSRKMADVGFGVNGIEQGKLPESNEKAGYFRIDVNDDASLDNDDSSNKMRHR